MIYETSSILLAGGEYVSVVFFSKSLKLYLFDFNILICDVETPLSLQSGSRLAVRAALGRDANRKISGLGECVV